MIAPSLPPDLKAALEQHLRGLPRADAAARAASISRTYRDGGTSAPITTKPDALAYVGTRMPATYAAVAACLNAVAELRPEFAPDTLLDAGAGPGTASFAAAQAFASLSSATLLDANPALREVALALAAEIHLPAFEYRLGDAAALLMRAQPAALVIASYVINELPDAGRDALVDLLWRNASDTLLIVEPGTPAGYARIIAARARLIAQGAHIIAPCPHERECPLAPPDWCHFVQRLPRSRSHQQLKSAEVPFEDEKFSYLAAARSGPATPRPSRVLAQPQQTKAAITARLCSADGLHDAVVPRRNKHAYARFRRLRWGDAISPGDANPA